VSGHLRVSGCPTRTGYVVELRKFRAPFDEIGHIVLGEVGEASVVGGVPNVDPDGQLLRAQSVVYLLIRKLAIER